MYSLFESTLWKNTFYPGYRESGFNSQEEYHKQRRMVAHEKLSNNPENYRMLHAAFMQSCGLLGFGISWGLGGSFVLDTAVAIASSAAAYYLSQNPQVQKALNKTADELAAALVYDVKSISVTA